MQGDLSSKDKLPFMILIRNAPSTAGNSMTGSDRPSPEPLLKKRGVPNRTGGERILEMRGKPQMPWSIGFGASQPYSQGNSKETLWERFQGLSGILPESPSRTGGMAHLKPPEQTAKIGFPADNAFPHRKTDFPTEECAFLQKNAVFRGTWQETAGNCGRVSWLKNQGRWPTSTRNFKMKNSLPN